jgi:peroxiredoxin
MDDAISFSPAPDLQVAEWINNDGPVTLLGLRGKVVVLEAFQMLCPGCVAHGLPQAQRIYETFSSDDVTVLGLHTVFEHHAAMTPVSIKAFAYEYKLRFPIGIDEPSAGGMPKTMQAYGMRGTPSLILIDSEGRLRSHYFGTVSDLQIGYQIANLLSERVASTPRDLGGQEVNSGVACDVDGCPVP